MKKLLDQTNRSKPSSGKSNLMTPGVTQRKSLEAAIEKLPVVVITLATTLPKEEIRRLGQWFRQNINPQILLEIRRDTKIIGGCQIIWQGLEGDFSLRRKFQEQKSEQISDQSAKIRS